MKLKLLQIIEAKQALQRLAGEKFPAHIAYRIQRNIRALEPEAVAFQSARDDLIRNKYGKEVEDTVTHQKQHQVKKENIPAFTEELNRLLDEQIELDIRMLALNDMKEITPLDIMALERMFETEEDSKPSVKAQRIRRQK